MQRETEERLETEAVNMIIERLLDLKPSLYWHYTREVCGCAYGFSHVGWVEYAAAKPCGDDKSMLACLVRVRKRCEVEV